MFRNNLKLPLHEEKMYIESVTYMICKNFGLDVRTYCQDSKFSSLLRSGKYNLSSFVVMTLKLYEKYASYFVMN